MNTMGILLAAHPWNLTYVAPQTADEINHLHDTINLL